MLIRRSILRAVQHSIPPLQVDEGLHYNSTSSKSSYFLKSLPHQTQLVPQKAQPHLLKKCPPDLCLPNLLPLQAPKLQLLLIAPEGLRLDLKVPIKTLILQLHPLQTALLNMHLHKTTFPNKSAALEGPSLDLKLSPEPLILQLLHLHKSPSQLVVAQKSPS